MASTIVELAALSTATSASPPPSFHVCDHPQSFVATPLSIAQRTDLTRERARAAAELLAIQDGLLGRGWRVRKRAAYLKGFINGASSQLARDLAMRN